MLKAGAAAMRWYQENKDRPTPVPPAEPPPYNAADAARVGALMARVGALMARLKATQSEVARACGMQSGALSHWLRGRQTRTPSVAPAVRWRQQNKDRPTPAAAAEPPTHNAADSVRVRALMARLRVAQRQWPGQYQAQRSVRFAHDMPVGRVRL